jgi:Ca-activated chloride channel family protein
VNGWWKSFEIVDPWILALLAPLAMGAWVLRRRRRPTLTLPDLARFEPRRTLRVRALGGLFWLRALALVLIVVAIARPRLGEERSIVKREGLAIQLVLDRSGSMEQEMRYGASTLPRIEVVKRIFDAFVRGGEGLSGRPSDLVGLTTFARFPEENCPLVSLHEPLLVAVKNLRTVAPFLTNARTPTWDHEEARFENPLSATAIGEALYRGALSLIAAEDDLRRARNKEGGNDAFRIQGKVMILLTDGENNSGRDPQEAARLAAANGIKVYSVLLADREIHKDTLLGRRVTRQLSDQELERLLDEPRAIAEATGGRAYLATDGEELTEIYQEIDELEHTELGTIEYASHRELFAWPLGIAFALLALGLALESTWLRVAP